ncbi:hypothetical protein A0256_23265 [Mucilaginibacter sp. PAMC 26640]|nr:hypothetical protein A0256_23265 [Mucilaginibacter sp. PAMC 26640]
MNNINWQDAEKEKPKEQRNNLNDYFLNKVAAGLRRMTVMPNAFIFFDKESKFYDRDKILGYPVYRTNFIYQGNGEDELSFYPVFLDPHFDSVNEVSRFRRGYEDY